MKWTKIRSHESLPKCCEDILFTDGKEVYKGWLESHEFGTDPIFYNVGSGESWPEDVTHWMPMPKLPRRNKNELD